MREEIWVAEAEVEVSACVLHLRGVEESGKGRKSMDGVSVSTFQQLL